MFDNTTAMTSQTGVIEISTANPNRDGTGAVVSFFTGGAANGSLVVSINVKAKDATDNGMVRIFLRRSDAFYLIEEFSIPATQPSDVVETYQATLYFPGSGYWLAPGDLLYASTENAEAFEVTGTGMDWAY